jgi:hypothetical protein
MQANGALRNFAISDVPMTKWTRPALCRLCKCPAVDSVLIDDLDSDKLAEWWNRKFGDECYKDKDERNKICNFCVAEARYNF